MNEWKKVVFLGDCETDDDDVFVCPECGEEYAECDCPGPTMEDEYEYQEIDGILYARLK